MSHDPTCPCFICEEDREERGEETLYAKKQRLRERKAKRLSKRTCICPDDEMLAYHTSKCMEHQSKLPRTLFEEDWDL